MPDVEADALTGLVAQDLQARPGHLDQVEAERAGGGPLDEVEPDPVAVALAVETASITRLRTSRLHVLAGSPVVLMIWCNDSSGVAMLNERRICVTFRRTSTGAPDP